MEKAVHIDMGFSTADAEFPNLSFQDQELIVTFKDWQENEIEIRFIDTIGFKYQEITSVLDGERYDDCHEIENSKWLDNQIKNGVGGRKIHYKHFRLNFNASWNQIEILASSFLVKK